MFCPKCKGDTKVIDSRDIDNGKEIRRRRECEKCGYRYTTYERPEIGRFMVIKSNGNKELYDREKLEKAIEIAIVKTDIDYLQIDNIISKLELEWMKNKTGITSKRIGKDVIEELKKISDVATIRYASVFYNFKHIEDFIKFINEIN